MKMDCGEYRICGSGGRRRRKKGGIKVKQRDAEARTEKAVYNPILFFFMAEIRQKKKHSDNNDDEEDNNYDDDSSERRGRLRGNRSRSCGHSSGERALSQRQTRFGFGIIFYLRQCHQFSQQPSHPCRNLLPSQFSQGFCFSPLFQFPLYILDFYFILLFSFLKFGPISIY